VTHVSIDPELLAVLRCPKCLGEVRPEVGPAGSAASGVACRSCMLLYKMEDGLLHLLVEEALPLRT
jgi:uncharacterized protein YbaR (Trm112 family)